MRDYLTADELANIGRTPELCQDALIEFMEELFEGKKYVGQEGRKPLTVYKQDLPTPEDNDVDADTDAAASPYMVVQMTGGAIPNDDAPQQVDFSLVICCYDTGKAKQGYQDVTNIKELIIQRLCTHPYFGGAFTVLRPISWALQVQDTSPYYFGAINFTCTAPAMTQDSELKELI